MRGNLFAMLSICVLTMGCSVGCSEPEAPRRRVAESKLESQGALVTIQFFVGDRPTTSCAGVLVGPQAVLTAGHCASKKYRAIVTAPNAGGKQSTSTRAWWFDWTDESTPKSSPQLHDVAILALESPISLPSYPKIAETSLTSGAKTTHVRRVRGKSRIKFEAVPGVARAANGHHHRIAAKDDKLDSGGPVFDPATGKIVGVVSAHAGSGVLHVAKTKSLTKWLRQQLLALLKNPPKKPDTSTTQKPGGSTKPPAPPSGGMGKQSGGGTKAPGKTGGASKAGENENKDPSETDKEDQENPECEGGDLGCDDVCGGEGGGGDCESPCEGGDDSCESPSCGESEDCQCDGTDCDDAIEDPDDSEVENESDESEGDEYGDESDDSGGDDSGGDDSGGDDYGGDDYGGEE